jgi:hypothetical protein
MHVFWLKTTMPCVLELQPQPNMVAIFHRLAQVAGSPRRFIAQFTTHLHPLEIGGVSKAAH